MNSDHFSPHSRRDPLSQVRFMSQVRFRGWPGIITLGALISVLMVAACQKPEPPPPKAVVRPVKTFEVTSAQSALKQSYPGTVRAAKRVDLAFKVPGPLVELPVEEGSEVKQGAVLARIMPRDFKIRLDEAQARAKEAEQQFKRYKELYVRKQVSKAEYDRYKASRDVTRAQLEDARNALQDTYLKAPFSGVIATRFVDNFEEVQAKQPIVSLQDVSSIEILVNVPELIMARIQASGQVDAVAEFESAPGQQFPLTLKEFATQADPATQTYQVVLLMDQPEGVNILPGMTATVTGTEEVGAGAGPTILIPAIAVLADDSNGIAFVWTLDENQMTVAKQQVKVGELTGREMIEVVEGLAGGERIAVAGITQLKEGQKVRLWDAQDK